MDYTHDQMAGGRKFRTLNLMDGYEHPRSPADRAGHVAARSARGANTGRSARTTGNTGRDPGRQREPSSSPVRSSISGPIKNQVALHFIERGKPTQNALIESFNVVFRDECAEPELVRGSETRTEGDRGLAGGLQHGTSAQLAEVSDRRKQFAA